MTKSMKDWSAADRRYGWKFGGEDGNDVVGVREAARLTGFSHAYIYEILKDEDRHDEGSRAYPLRIGERPHMNTICICRRSIEEFKKLRRPIEV